MKRLFKKLSKNNEQPQQQEVEIGAPTNVQHAGGTGATPEILALLNQANADNQPVVGQFTAAHAQGQQPQNGVVIGGRR